MKAVKKGLIAISMALVVLLIAGGAVFMFGMKEEILKENYYLEPGSLLDVNNKRGTITITGWKQDYIEIIAVKQSVLGLFFDQVSIEVIDEERFAVSTKYCTSMSQGVGVDYSIRVPDGVLVSQVNNLAGSINIEHVEGDVIVQTASGSININNVPGSVSAKTSRGAIKINEAAGFVSAISETGNISIREAGGIHKIHTDRGNILLDVLAIQECLEVSSQSGSITAFLSPGLDAYIEVSTSSGNISHEDLSPSVIELTSNKLIASIGEGSNKINITTSSGSINLKIMP